MPTPIGHSLLSTAIFSGVNRKKLKLNWFDYLVFLFIGIFPDLDFLPGLILGTPSRLHHGFTHSLFFGIIIGAMTGLLYHKWRGKHWLNYSLVFTAVYFSHLIADFFGVDTSHPFGEQLFWPFWQAYILSPVSIFSDVYRSSKSGDFFVSMFNWHNFEAVILELLICIPILFLINYRKVSQGK